MLIIDDVGLLPLSDRDAAGAFFHVVDTRYERKHPTIVTTNRGCPTGGQIFGDPVVAAAILDRLMHNAVVFNIKGPSGRLREHQALSTATTNHATLIFIPWSLSSRWCCRRQPRRRRAAPDIRYQGSSPGHR